MRCSWRSWRIITTGGQPISARRSKGSAPPGVGTRSLEALGSGGVGVRPIFNFKLKNGSDPRQRLEIRLPISPGRVRRGGHLLVVDVEHERALGALEGPDAMAQGPVLLEVEAHDVRDDPVTLVALQVELQAPPSSTVRSPS